MAIPVMDSILRMRSGQLEAVAEDFVTCIHCGLCRFVCEDRVQPHSMGMWVRRSIGASQKLVEEQTGSTNWEQVNREWEYLTEGNSGQRLEHARRFRERGRIEK
jgi:ferredoxin